MSVRGKVRVNDQAKEGEGVLVTSFGDGECLMVGEVRIHLDMIKCSGFEGGLRDIRVICIGPRSVPIKRVRK